MFTISTLESFELTFYYIYDTVLYDIINATCNIAVQQDLLRLLDTYNYYILKDTKRHREIF